VAKRVKRAERALDRASGYADDGSDTPAASALNAVDKNLAAALKAANKRVAAAPTPGCAGTWPTPARRTRASTTTASRARQPPAADGPAAPDARRGTGRGRPLAGDGHGERRLHDRRACVAGGHLRAIYGY
jgi:hypothetical protein